MWYSVILWKFAKRAQLTFGAVAKINLFPFRMYGQKQKDTNLLSCSTYLLTKLSNMNNIKAAILCMNKLSTACKFACGIQEFNAAIYR